MRCELKNSNCPKMRGFLSKGVQTVQNGEDILTVNLQTTDGEPGVVAENATPAEADWTDRQDVEPGEDILAGNLLAMERAKA